MKEWLEAGKKTAVQSHRRVLRPWARTAGYQASDARFERVSRGLPACVSVVTVHVTLVIHTVGANCRSRRWGPPGAAFSRSRSDPHHDYAEHGRKITTISTLVACRVTGGGDGAREPDRASRPARRCRAVNACIAGSVRVRCRCSQPVGPGGGSRLLIRHHWARPRRCHERNTIATQTGIRLQPNPDIMTGNRVCPTALAVEATVNPRGHRHDPPAWPFYMRAARAGGWLRPPAA